MVRRDSNSQRKRPLALECLELRAMCALTPVHVVIPASGVIGSTLRPDGSIEVYGLDAQPFPSHVIIGDGSDSSVDEAPDEEPSGQKKWLIDADGRLLSKTALDFPAAGSTRIVYDISPDGQWFVGLKSSTSPSEPGVTVVWRRGMNDLTPVGVTTDQTGGPLVQGVSNNGDVIYRAYVGDDLEYFAWNRTAGLLPLKSLYELEGSASPDAAKFSLQAISGDGRTIVGSSGGGDLPTRATLWVDGVAQELHADGHENSYAFSVSDDGRVIGGSITVSEYSRREAVWVDGVLQELTFAPNTYGIGTVGQVVNGVRGDPSEWAAVGWLGAWLARSDGVAHKLSSYLTEHYGLSLLGNNQQVDLLASDDALYLVTSESPSTMCAGFNCYTSGQYATHVLILPYDFELPTQLEAYDFTNDGVVSPIDAVLIINALNASGGGALSLLPNVLNSLPGIDLNGDGLLSPADPILVINYLNAPPSPQPNAIDSAATVNAESQAEGESSTTLDDEILFLLADDLYTESMAQRKRSAK